MRLVLDTNVVASAILWGGSPRLLLQAAREKRIALYTSTPMLAELSDILARRKFARKIAASLLTIEQLVDGSMCNWPLWFGHQRWQASRPMPTMTS